MFRIMRKGLLSFLLLLILSGHQHALATNRPKIGLVLSGGGAKGFAHIGILKMLDSLQIRVDYIAGTSMGGIVGALYAIGYTGEEIETLILDTDWHDVFTDNPERSKLPYLEKKEAGKYQFEFGLEGLRPVPPSGLIYGQKISLLFSELIDPYGFKTDFSKLPIPYQCVAVNIETGKQVVLKQGSLAKAMRATMSIPSVFSPVQWGDSLLVDGGMVNNLPVDVVQQMGADIIIAVDVASQFLTHDKLNTAVAVFEQSIYMLGITQWLQNIKHADLYIQPDLRRYTLMDFNRRKIEGILNAGEMAAKANLDSLIDLKNKLRIAQQPTITDLNKVKPPIKKPLIHGISITGNKIIPFGSIYQLLGLHPGDRLNIDQLNRRILEIYGLGYFEHINYEIESRDIYHAQINIHIKEKHKRRLRVGLRYDNQYKLVAILAVQGTNMLIPGLRYEHELQFAGLYHYQFKTFYPSRTLNLPLYPYVRFQYQDIPFDVFDLYVGDKIAQYKDRSYTVAGGLGILLGKNFNFEIEYGMENLDIHPDVAFNDPLRFPDYEHDLKKIKSTVIFDALDDLSTPNYGCYLLANYENSLKKFGSDLDYESVQFSADIYHTIKKRHTIRFYGFHGFGESLPIYKTHNQGHPHTFIGMQFDQLFGNELSLLRTDYRIRIRNSTYITLTYNKAFNLAQETEFYKIYPDDVQGYGIGFKLDSPIGALELIFGRGNQHFGENNEFQNVVYFLLGSSIDKFLFK